MKKISDIAKIVGVSSSALRLYEDKGLVHPERDSETGYRYYDVSEMSFLCYSHKCRSYGFTMNDLAKIRFSNDVASNHDLFKDRIEDMEQSIIRQKSILACLKREESVLREAVLHENEIWQGIRPAMYRIVYYVQDDICIERGMEKTVAAWMQSVPYRLMITVIPSHDLNNSNDIWSGVAILEDDLPYVDVDTGNLYAKYLPAVESLVTIVRSKRGNDVIRDRIKPLFEEAKRLGVVITGDIISYDFTGLEQGHEVLRKIWAPIKPQL